MFFCLCASPFLVYCLVIPPSCVGWFPITHSVQPNGTLDMHFAGFQLFSHPCNYGANGTETGQGCDLADFYADYTFYFKQVFEPTPARPCPTCPLTALTCCSPFLQMVNMARFKNVTVRLLTNDYGVPTNPGKISTLDFLALNGVQIKWYASTTYTHSKVFIVDRREASVSSLNLDYLPFAYNREAGVIVNGTTPAGQQIVDAYNAVFDFDWKLGVPYTINGTYNASTLAAIKQK